MVESMALIPANTVEIKLMSISDLLQAEKLWAGKQEDIQIEFDRLSKAGVVPMYRSTR